MPKYPSAQPKLLGVKYESKIGRAYGKFEFEVIFGASYINPFDPEDIYVNASFNTPSGRNEEIPAFYHVDYEEKPRGGNCIVEGGIKHVENLEIILDGFKPGKYLIEHWDSFIGQIFKEQSVESDGKIMLFIDRIEKDFAAKIRHCRGKRS
ncbi:hypothetical protein KEJ34_01985 [Candidatus Bathyarchaeota archaeon]|nr:hypothetical protein [Candidatus Bathyarchaeota archaeon]